MSEHAAEIADSVVLDAVSIAWAIRQHIEALFAEPTIITTRMLIAMLYTHILGTSLTKEFDNSANVGSHSKHFHRLKVTFEICTK